MFQQIILQSNKYDRY